MLVYLEIPFFFLTGFHGLHVIIGQERKIKRGEKEMQFVRSSMLQQKASGSMAGFSIILNFLSINPLSILDRFFSMKADCDKILRISE